MPIWLKNSIFLIFWPKFGHFYKFCPANREKCNNCICIYIYIYTNLPVDVRWYSQGQETFLALSADKQTCNWDIECSNHHSSLSTLRPKGLSHSKMKWWAIYTNLPKNIIVRLPHPGSGDYIYIFLGDSFC